ncbi:MAG TPA: hypothetical protein VMQ83_04990 [Gammaproteobacteria bacterium]|nr:hypothetical protein [Gammaproteobacteria bacterium]
MKRKLVLISTGALLLAFSSAWAQEAGEEDNGEATIQLIGDAEAELPDAVTDEITLPASVPEDSAAVVNAQHGLDRANENRARREFGLATAEEARERGAGMAEEAMKNRETRGRSENLPATPDVPNRRGPPGT